MRKAINLIKTVIGVLRQIATSHTLQICIEHLKKALEVLEHPLWETPEQWEKRTGEAWPEDWATYVRLIFAKHGWDPYRYVTAKSLQRMNPGTIVVIATESGPPPDDWRPEEMP